jgi:hypothetical protein
MKKVNLNYYSINNSLLPIASKKVRLLQVKIQKKKKKKKRYPFFSDFILLQSLNILKNKS